MLQSALISNVLIISQMLVLQFLRNFLMKLIDMWKVSISIEYIVYLYWSHDHVAC